MSYLYGMDPRAQANLSDQLDNTKGAPQQLDNTKGAPQQLGAFDNFWAAVGGNLAAGGLKVAQLGTYFRDPDEAAATAMAHGIMGDNTDWQAEDEKARVEARRALAIKAKEVMPNPLKTGWASNIVGGLAQVVPTAVVGAAIAGPAGAMALVGGSQGVGDYQQSLLDGVDPTTAAKKAALTGVASGLGVGIPMAKAGAGLLANLGIGAGVNVGLGMAQRAGTAAILEGGGYHDMAAQYKWLDGEAIAVDAVLGAAFGGIGHLMHGAGGEARPTPEHVDAALALNDRLHIENEAQPGVHRTVESRDAGVAAMTKAVDDMLVRDRMPDVAEAAARMDVEPNPAARAFHEEVQQQLDLELPKLEAAHDTLPSEPAGVPGAKTLRVEREDAKSAMYQIVDETGEQIGQILVLKKTASIDGELGHVEQIHNAGINDPAMKGKGYGIKSYMELVDRALAEGKQVWSDPSVSAEAQRMYASLKRRGYTVEENAKKPPTREADGTLVSDGSFVYKITKGPEVKAEAAKPLTAHDNTPEGMAKAGDVQPVERAMAQQLLDAHPDLEVPTPHLDADGKPVMAKFSDVLAAMDRDIQQAQKDSVLHDVAVACFLRG